MSLDNVVGFSTWQQSIDAVMISQNQSGEERSF